MPNRRKPTKILELAGAFKHNPARGRERAAEPVSNAPISEAPPRLEATEREIWNEIRGQLVEGVALESDAIAFETLVKLVAAMRRGALDAKEMGHLVRLFGLFGMTPADRSRVSVPTGAKPKNSFAALG